MVASSSCGGNYSRLSNLRPLRYVQTEDNDLGYWGLDYPPLSGYQASAADTLYKEQQPLPVMAHFTR